MANWHRAERKMGHDTALKLNPAIGKIKKLHSTLFEWCTDEGERVEFVSNMGVPCLGGYIIVVDSIPTYMDSTTYAATYIS